MAMKYWIVKKGNKSVRDFEIRDKDGNTVTNLADALEIKFQIKKNKTDAALVEKTKDDGIQVNTPSEGYLRITLLPVDTGTSLDKGDYYFALQIKWSDTDIYELKVMIDDVEAENLRVKQDIIT